MVREKRTTTASVTAETTPIAPAVKLKVCTGTLLTTAGSSAGADDALFAPLLSSLAFRANSAATPAVAALTTNIVRLSD
ncbi:hypothetical protein ZWY2020_035979 [Hordeum vulgare]|nr:hypothetical protein ZWY2020_035979 [Hordeum vulgare]